MLSGAPAPAPEPSTAFDRVTQREAAGGDHQSRPPTVGIQLTE